MNRGSAPPERLPHVTFLARSLETGGAETQLVALATRLLASGRFTASVVTFYPEGELSKRLIEASVPVESIGKRGRWDFAVARLTTCIRRHRPDLLHSYLGPPNLMAALLGPFLGGPRIVWGLRASDMDLRHYDWTWRAVYQAERALSRIPHRIVANSSAGRDLAVHAGFPAARLAVIPNGIDTARFAPAAQGSAALRAEWLRGSAGPLIGLVARLDPMKDHETFLRAAQRLSTSATGARFVCVGAGPEAFSARLRGIADDLGIGHRVVWAGRRHDVPAALNALDIATLSSAFGEGFPNVVGEAMACGIPCVVTDVGDSAMIVANTGTIVPRRDPEALAEGWRAMLAAPEAERQRRAQAARARIVDNFSLDAMVAATAALYRDVLGIR